MPAASETVAAAASVRRIADRRQAWHVAIAGMLSLAVAMGIGRFAFTPLLPMMLHDGLLDLHEGSWLATANYLGYFVGALLCMMIRIPAARMMRIGLVATLLLTLGMGVLHGMPAWVALRALSGIASALVFVFTAGWCLRRLAQLGHPALGGVIFCGPGLGILATGLPAGPMVAAGWRAMSGWLLFGALAAVLIAACWRTIREPRADIANAPAASAHAAGARGRASLTLAYGLAGFGYIITATFLPVIARQALPGSIWPDLFWPMVGGGVTIGALLATRVSLDHDNRLLLAICHALQAAGIGLGIVWPTVAGFALGSLLVGLPFTALTLFAMREARRLAGEGATRLIGLMTAVYGIGQIVGPPFAAALVERTGSFTPSLAVAAAALLVGAAMYLAGRERRAALA